MCAVLHCTGAQCSLCDTGSDPEIIASRPLLPAVLRGFWLFCNEGDSPLHENCCEKEEKEQDHQKMKKRRRRTRGGGGRREVTKTNKFAHAGKLSSPCTKTTPQKKKKGGEEEVGGKAVGAKRSRA